MHAEQIWRRVNGIIAVAVGLLISTAPAAAQSFYDGPVSYQVGAGASLSVRLGTKFGDVYGLKRVHGVVHVFADGTYRVEDGPGGGPLRPSLGAVVAVRVLGADEVQVEPILRAGLGTFHTNRTAAHFHDWSTQAEVGFAWRPRDHSFAPLVGVAGRMLFLRAGVRVRPEKWTTVDLGLEMGLVPYSFLESSLSSRRTPPETGGVEAP
jgi:hypothetical protein